MNTKSATTTTVTEVTKKSHGMKALQLSLALLVGLFAQGSLAQTTVLNFDDLADGTVLTSQYASRGVTASGVEISGNGLYTPSSSPNVAIAPSGLMTFILNSSITGNVKTVSARISGVDGTGTDAYAA